MSYHKTLASQTLKQCLPRVCMSSCVTTPVPGQPSPKDNGCSPPTRPRLA